MTWGPTAPLVPQGRPTDRVTGLSRVLGGSQKSPQPLWHGGTLGELVTSSVTWKALSQQLL